MCGANCGASLHVNLHGPCIPPWLHAATPKVLKLRPGPLLALYMGQVCGVWIEVIAGMGGGGSGGELIGLGGVFTFVFKGFVEYLFPTVLWHICLQPSCSIVDSGHVGYICLQLSCGMYMSPTVLHMSSGVFICPRSVAICVSNLPVAYLFPLVQLFSCLSPSCGIFVFIPLVVYFSQDSAFVSWHL